MTRTCSATDCRRKHYARGYCEAHYRRAKRGLPMDEPIIAMGVPFWDRADKAGGLDSCWQWTGHRHSNGYGSYWVSEEGRPEMAHRHAASLAFGDIPAGAFVMHHCDNPACVNPLHLSVADHAENMADMVAKGRSCRGEKHGQAKVTDAQRAEIAADPRPQRQIAADYGISQSSVSLIKKALLIAVAGQRRNGENWTRAVERGETGEAA